MESTLRLCLRFLLIGLWISNSNTYSIKTQLTDTYRNQHLPEIPGYIPVYIKQEGPLAPFKAQTIKTKQKNKPQLGKIKDELTRKTVLNSALGSYHQEHRTHEHHEHERPNEHNHGLHHEHERPHEHNHGPHHKHERPHEHNHGPHHEHERPHEHNHGPHHKHERPHEHNHGPHHEHGRPHEHEAHEHGRPHEHEYIRPTQDNLISSSLGNVEHTSKRPQGYGNNVHGRLIIGYGLEKQ